jgi:hypothetical protein
MSDDHVVIARPLFRRGGILPTSIALAQTHAPSQYARNFVAAALVLAALLLSAQAALAQFSQQGSKLIASDAIGNAQQGVSVGVSADGNTAIVGGDEDNSGIGGAWIFVRTGGAWAEQAKLVGTGAQGQAQQGISVALSGDGNTAIVGGWTDNNHAGAAWVFTRSGGLWTQQGAKLVGTGGSSNASQGNFVALSADGNTALVAGDNDGSGAGAVWVFTRSGGGIWSQQGSKLVGNGAVGPAAQGISVAISADANTLISGGWNDNSGVGAAWVFTRSGNVWTQQGTKLVGVGALGKAQQGTGLALSADGSTALVGGPEDNSGLGAMWVFTFGGGTWNQQGGKLIGAGAVGSAAQGAFAALSASGNTALVSGFLDNNNAGATWVFTRAGNAWTQQGAKLVGSGTAGSANQGSSVALSADGSTAIVGGYGDASGFGATWVFALPPSPLLAAILPESRSAQVGGTITAFATIINTGATIASACSIFPSAILPATFLYQTTNPQTNALTGSANTQVDIAAGAPQSFVVALTPSAAIVPTNVSFYFSCANAAPAPIVAGLNTLLFSASIGPIPDVVALAATLQNDGIVHVTGTPSAGVFAIATDNLGAGSTFTVAANTGTATLPLTITVCQTNPQSGQCLQAPSATVSTSIGGGATPTFAIFVSASGTVPFNPANSRIFVTFTDSGNAIRGETSVAVETM